MKDMNALFLRLPEVAVITDEYGYILEYNRGIDGIKLKKGKQIKSVMPDVLKVTEDKYTVGQKVYERRVTPIKRGNSIVGFTILLADITAETEIFEQQKQENSKLSQLIAENVKGNAKLQEYAMKVKELTDYEEQLQIARRIHDDAGHAITAIHTISQMCLTLSDKDPSMYSELINEGLAICNKAVNGYDGNSYKSVKDILDIIVRECRFPIEVKIEGDEPEFADKLYETIDRICREAYHNTIDHSMADKLFICVNMTERQIKLDIYDNGNFHGEFEKGFGLSTMEDIVHRTDGEITFIAQTGKGFGIQIIWGEIHE